MASTTRMPRQQRRAQLLDLATGVFTEKGFHATSMDDIAAAAGVTKPVLYQHFESKETLYLEVMDILAVTLLEDVRGLAEAPGDTSARVRLGMDRFYQLTSLNNALTLFAGRDQVSETVRRKVSDVLDAMAIELGGVLAASRQVTTAQARVLGRAMIALAQTTAVLMHDAAEGERSTILETMSLVAVEGLTAFEPLDHPAVAGTVQGRSDG